MGSQEFGWLGLFRNFNPVNQSLKVLMRVWLLLALLTCSHGAFAQGYSASDSAAIQEALSATYPIERIDVERAIARYDSLYAVSIQKNYTVGAGRSKLFKGIVLNNLGRYREAMEHYEASLPYFAEANFIKGVASAHNNMGVTYNFTGELDSAATHYMLALQHFEAMADTNTMLIGYGNVGGIFMEMKQYGKAEPYFRKGLQVAKQFGDSIRMADALNNMGYLSKSKEQYAEAKQHYKESLSIANAMQNHPAQYLAHNNLGDLYYLLEDKEAALFHSIAAHDYANRTDNPFYTVHTGNNLGLRYAWLDMPDSAAHYLGQTVQLAGELGQKKLQADASLYLAEQRAKTGQYDEAYTWLTKYIALLDALRPERQEQLINELETKYQTAEKDAALAMQELQMAEAETRAARSQFYTAITLAGMLVLLILAYAFYRNSRHKLRLQEERMQRIEQDKAMTQLKAMLEGEERERRRLARELHDGIGGQLALIRAQMKSGETVEAVSGKLSSTDAEVRRIAHNLMPEILLKHGLGKALQTFADEMDNHPCPVHFELLGDVPQHLPTATGLACYRIAQELVKNAAKHAGPCSIFIQLIADEESIELTVEDDGKGMSEVDTNGIGLGSVEERLKAIGGHLRIDSAAGRGTTASIVVPLTIQMAQE